MQSNICFKCQCQNFKWETYVLEEDQEGFELTRPIELIKTRAVYDGSSYIIYLPEREAFNPGVPEWKQVILSKHNYIVGSFPQKGVVCHFYNGNIITLIS